MTSVSAHRSPDLRTASPEPAGRGLRVLMVEAQASGGIWHYACALARALAAAGLEVTVGTAYPFEPLAGMDGVSIRIIGSRGRRGVWPPQALAVRLFEHARRLAGIMRLVREVRPHVVHLHEAMGRLDFVYTRILRANGCRVVYTAHDPQPLGRRATWFDVVKFRRADAVLVHSRNGIDDLTLRGVAREKIVEILHGNYLDFCNDSGLSSSDAREGLGLPEHARVVLFFGAISPYKGVDLLVKAFSLLVRTDSNVYLVIAGHPRMDLAPLRRLIGRLGLTDRIRTDFRYLPLDEFSRFFVACDVVVLPYRRIYQSGVLQLAYGFGRPVVVTDVGGIGEAVREDRTGIVAAPEDADAMAAAMAEVLRDPEAARKMGARARYLAQSKYSWDRIAREVAHVYESVVSPVRA